jgi:hypothetical protein
LQPGSAEKLETVMNNASLRADCAGAQDFFSLPSKALKVLVDAQRRLLRARRRHGLPIDERSVRNLHAVEEQIRREAA